MANLKNIFALGAAIIGTFTSTAFAGWTTQKNVLDTYIEYEFGWADRQISPDFYATNKKLNSTIEAGAEIGVTDRASVGIIYSPAFYHKKATYGLPSDTGADGTFIEIFHKLSFEPFQKVDFGLWNSIRYTNSGHSGDHDYVDMWRLRGMVRHREKAGIYKQARMDLEYRRRFAYDAADTVRVDLRTSLRLSEQVDLLVRLVTNFKFASANAINNGVFNPDDINPYFFNGGGRAKINDMFLYVGPEFPGFAKNHSAYVYGRVDITGRAIEHQRGILAGYAISFDL